MTEFTIGNICKEVQRIQFDLEAYQAEKIAEIEAYKNGADTFLEEQKAQRDTIVASAVEAINAAADKETIDAAVATAKAQIDALPTASELLEEQLRAAKNAAIAELNAYLADGEYSATAWGCDLTYDYVKINGDYRT